MDWGWTMEKKAVDRDCDKKPLWHERGVTYFDKRTERCAFFFATVLMLVWGLLEKFVL
jgi:hypothetical protein